MKPFWTNGVATLYNADARNIPILDKSVHCAVTSPPYWGMRDYGLSHWEGGDPECSHSRDNKTASAPTNVNDSLQPWPAGICGRCGAKKHTAGIGLEPTVWEWVANIVAMGREVWRVLRDDGTFWLNLGDCYAGSGGPGGDFRDGKGGDTYLRPYHREGAGLPSKNLVGQPWRAVFALQDDGWILRRDIIWHKLNPMPESVTDRPTGSHEYIFLFAKSNTAQFWTHRERTGTRTAPAPDYLWTDAADGQEYRYEPANWSDEMIACPDCDGSGEFTIQVGQVSLFDGIPTLVSDCSRCNEGRIDQPGYVKRWKRTNLWQSHDYFYDMEAIKEPARQWPPHLPGGRSKGGVRQDDDIQERWAKKYAAGEVSGTANIRSVWSIPTSPYKGAHFATFPPEIPRRCIQAGTSERGVCADCGAPWVRQVEKSAAPHDGETQSSYVKGSNANRIALVRQAARSRGGEYSQEVKTTNWQPTCDCNAATVPATVLDPFAGSGTALMVAQSLGRSGVGCDLNPAYLDIAVQRIGPVSV